MNAATYLLLDGGAANAHRLKGRVRVYEGGYYGDDTGYRRILLNSDFPLFYMWTHHNAEARAGVLATKRAKFHGSRVLHLIARDADAAPTTNPNDYWYQRDSGKEEFRASAVEALTFMRDNGLRVILSAGHEYKNKTDEYAWWEELTGIIRDAKLADVLLWVEALGNEVSVNRGWLAQDTPAAMEYVKPIHEIVRRNLPGVLISNGDFGEEDDIADVGSVSPSLCGSSAGADMIDIHPGRDMPNSVRHVHTIWYATHYFHSCVKPISEGEEPGENLPYEENRADRPRNWGGDVYAGCDNPYYLHTRVSLDQVTGQATTYLNGPGVRRFVPLNSTIYHDKIVQSVSCLPEDVMTWQDDRNPSWFNRGKNFVYVGLTAWGQIQRPPRPVASWEFYDIDGLVARGEGKPVIPTGWLGGILKGVYA